MSQYQSGCALNDARRKPETTERQLGKTMRQGTFKRRRRVQRQSSITDSSIEAILRLLAMRSRRRSIVCDRARALHTSTICMKQHWAFLLTLTPMYFRGEAHLEGMSLC